MNAASLRVWLALACEAVLLGALIAVLRVAMGEEALISRVPYLILLATPIVGLWLAWWWREPLQAWLVAIAIAPGYLLLVVLIGADHFGGWFDIAFFVISLWGVLLAGVGAFVGHIALKRQASGTRSSGA